MSSIRPIALFGLLLLGSIGWAQNAVIRLRTFPSVMLADGRSTATVSAEILDSNGRRVPDGTQVVFYTTLGSFRENVVQTINGTAHGILVASSAPGTGTITVNALAYNATTTMVYDFVGDRSLLSKSQEYIEVYAPEYLQYSLEDRILEASGPERGARLSYKTVTIEADDLQYNVSSFEVVAKNAILKAGKWSHPFKQLRYTLSTRKGVGLTTIEEEVEGEKRARAAIVDIDGQTLTPHTEMVASTVFDFQEIVEGVQHVSGDKVIVFPSKEIYFYKASVFVDGKKALAVPMLQVNLDGRTPLFTDEIFQVNNNQLTVSYPHYLSLKPGQTSLLRLSTGGQYGRSTISQSGIFLDYELKWNKGDQAQGGFTFGGMGRQDWGLGANHFQRFDDRTTGYFQVELPAHRSVFGSGSISRQFDGFSASVNGNATSTLQGDLYRSQTTSLIVEKDPTKVGALPVRMYLGLTAANAQRTSGAGTASQTTYGLRVRSQLLPQQIGPSTQVNGSAFVSKVTGRNALRGLTYGATLSMAQRLGREAVLNLTYDFIEDGFNSDLIGRHRLSAQGYAYKGRTSISVFASKSLDLDRLSYFGDLSYRMHRDWRVATTYTLDRYLGESYKNYGFLLGYKIGEREVGLTWSYNTKRIGVQFLGAQLR